MHRLLTMLREIGVTAPKPVQFKDCQEQLADEYEHYLLHERGLAQTSVLNYVPFAEQFLTHRLPVGNDHLQLDPQGCDKVHSR